MKIMNRLLLSACLALPLAACQQEEVVEETTEAAPLSAPQTEDRNEWRAYLNDVVGRHMEGIYNQPYVYLVPPARDNVAAAPVETEEGAEGAEAASGVTEGPELIEEVNSADAEYLRLAERAEMDLARGIVRGNLLAYAGADSGRTADLVVRAFEDVPDATMEGVRVLFIGDEADNERVQQAVAPAGVEYIFIQK